MEASSGRLRELRNAASLLQSACDRLVLSQLVVAVALVAASGLLSALAPLALKEVLDDVAHLSEGPAGTLGDGGQRWMSLMQLVGYYVAALTAARMLAALRPWPAGTAEQRLSANLTRRGFDRFLELPLTNRLGHVPGAPAHALDQAVAGCQILVAHGVGSVVPVMVELVTVLGVLIHLQQPSIVVAFGASALAYLSLQAAASPDTVQRAQAVAAGAQAVRTTLTEGLSQPESVKGLGLEQAVRLRLARTLGGLEHAWRALHLQQVRLGLINASCIAACLTTLLALALAGVQAGTLSGGGFVLINVYLLQLLRPLETLGYAMRDMAQALGFMRPLLDMTGGANSCTAASTPAGKARAAASTPLAATTSAPSARPRGDTSAVAPAIRFRGVRFGYDKSRPLLQDINLCVPAGTVLALVGPSGSGKSTLIRLLLRLIQPQVGAVLLDGVPLSFVSLQELQATTGVVFQDNLLIDDTVAANIAFGSPNASNSDVTQAARLAQLDRCIEALPNGYDTRIGERGVRLSGGERQRVAIARAVVRRPRLLLLDEATSMLDTVTEQSVLRGLQSARAECTTIVVAHRLCSVRHAQQIAVMEAGRVVECGDHSSLLLRDGAYSRLWRAQGALP